MPPLGGPVSPSFLMRCLIYHNYKVKKGLVCDTAAYFSSSWLEKLGVKESLKKKMAEGEGMPWARTALRIYLCDCAGREYRRREKYGALESEKGDPEIIFF